MKMMTMRVRAYVWIFWLTLTVTSGSVAAQADLLGLVNVNEYSAQMASSGQPTRDQIADIKASGVQLVVNLFPPGLPGTLKDEAELVNAAGMQYALIPVDWDKPSLDMLGQFFDLMDKNKGKKILVHCWLNSRASAFVYLHRTLIQNEPEKAEFARLVALWDYSKGYELAWVRQWREFIDVARKKYRP